MVWSPVAAHLKSLTTRLSTGPAIIVLPSVESDLDGFENRVQIELFAEMLEVITQLCDGR